MVTASLIGKEDLDKDCHDGTSRRQTVRDEQIAKNFSHVVAISTGRRGLNLPKLALDKVLNLIALDILGLLENPSLNLLVREGPIEKDELGA